MCARPEVQFYKEVGDRGHVLVGICSSLVTDKEGEARNHSERVRRLQCRTLEKDSRGGLHWLAPDDSFLRGCGLLPSLPPLLAQGQNTPRPQQEQEETLLSICCPHSFFRQCHDIAYFSVIGDIFLQSLASDRVLPGLKRSFSGGEHGGQKESGH